MMDIMITFGPRRGVSRSFSWDLKLEQIICVAICLLLCVSSSTLSSFVSSLEIDRTKRATYRQELYLNTIKPRDADNDCS